MKKEFKDRLRSFYRETSQPIDQGAKARTIAMIANEARLQDHSSVQHDASLQVAASTHLSMSLQNDVLAHEKSSGSLRLTSERTGFIKFTLGQVRFMSMKVWIFQLLLIVALIGISFSGLASMVILPLVACLSLLAVLVCIPEVFKSFDTGVAELEYASQFDCTQVLAARAAILGAADIVWFTVAICIVPAVAGCDAIQMALSACIPFFLACGGCFWIVRLRPQNVTLTCSLLVVILIAACGVAWLLWPLWYTSVSALAWLVILMLSLGFAAFEGYRVFREASQGLECITSSNQ